MKIEEALGVNIVGAAGSETRQLLSCRVFICQRPGNFWRQKYERVRVATRPVSQADRPETLNVPFLPLPVGCVFCCCKCLNKLKIYNTNTCHATLLVSDKAVGVANKWIAFFATCDSVLPNLFDLPSCICCR